ncbi:MAG: STT3 domain-containing protein [Candidatus Woesearchaeota archaeon]
MEEKRDEIEDGLKDSFRNEVNEGVKPVVANEKVELGNVRKREEEASVSHSIQEKEKVEDAKKKGFVGSVKLKLSKSGFLKLDSLKSIKRFFNKNIVYYIGLALVVFFGVFIRTRNLNLLKDSVTGKYIPLALDPFYFLRIAREISSGGGLFVWDTMRYYPIGIDPNKENLFLSYVIVYMHKGLNLIFPNVTLEYVDVIYPVIFFTLSVIIFYLLVRELFDNKIALLSALLLVIIPSYLYRTMAGFSDKESLGLFFMFLTFYFFIKALKQKNLKYAIVFGALAGVSTGLMGLSWGGVKFIFIIIALLNLILFFINKDNLKITYIYIAWIIPITIMLGMITTKYGGFIGLLKSSTTGITYIILFIFLANISLSRIDFIKRIKIPQNLLTILIVVIGTTIFASLIIGIATITSADNNALKGLSVFSIGSDIKGMLISGLGTDRLSLTVAENKQPYIDTWIENFKSLFYLFFISSIVLFYYMIKPIKKHIKKLTVAYIIFITGLIFSRYSPNSLFNGENIISKIMFVGSILFFGMALLIFYLYAYYKEKDTYTNINNLKINYIFLFIWFLMMIIAGRSAIRLLLMLVPVLAVFVSFLVFQAWDYAKKIDDKIYKYAIYLIILVIILPQIYSNSAISLQSARGTGPSYNQQWQIAMDWVGKNTLENAVFAHWWDYGYWVQTGAGRSTITDGGNYYPYWNHLMGRHVLSARSEEESLEFLKAHEASHLLVISDEIGKYTAYSSIGSDENFDVFSWISTFVMLPQATSKEGDTMNYIFSGATPLDENFVYNDKVYPEKKAYIGGFILPVRENDEEYEILQPKALIFYQGQRDEIPVECVYNNDKKIFFNKTGIQGCMRIMPRILPGFRYQQENGALLWVSRRGVSALWTKLFLFNEETPNFELIYDDSGKFKLAYYQGNIIGPLKIWKINYPENLTVSKELEEEYLALSTPEWLKLSGITI